MRYYDNDFRKNLQEILKTYRGMLTRQIATADDDNNKNNLPLLESQIKQIDEALKIIKPSMTDILTERKIEKLQKENFCNAKVEEIRKQARQDFEKEVRQAFTKKMEDKLRAELKPKIKEEVQQEIAQKQNEENFKQMKSQIVGFIQKAFSEQQNNTSSTSNSQKPVTLKKDKQKVEDKNDNDDTFKEDESMYESLTME